MVQCDHAAQPIATGAPPASKTLARFVELEFSSSSRRLKNKRAPEGTLVFLARPERFELPTEPIVTTFG
jgi:hypothetical protein